MAKQKFMVIQWRFKVISSWQVPYPRGQGYGVKNNAKCLELDYKAGQLSKHTETALLTSYIKSVITLTAMYKCSNGHVSTISSSTCINIGHKILKIWSSWKIFYRITAMNTAYIRSGIKMASRRLADLSFSTSFTGWTHHRSKDMF